MTAKRKHLILAKQRHRVSRVEQVPEIDYRWWRYVDTEPACGYVDTSYTMRTCPYARADKASTRIRPKTFLSNTQLRRRLARSGIPRSIVSDALRQVRAAEFDMLSDSFKAGRFVGPLERSLIAVIGPHATRRVMKGVREPFIFMDEFWSFVPSFMPEVVSPMAQVDRPSAELEAAAL